MKAVTLPSHQDEMRDPLVISSHTLLRGNRQSRVLCTETSSLTKNVASDAKGPILPEQKFACRKIQESLGQLLRLYSCASCPRPHLFSSCPASGSNTNGNTVPGPR